MQSRSINKKEGIKVKEILMFILGSWVFASLSVIWILGIAIIARAFVEAGKWVFEFKFKKKEGRKVID